jgi:hypothetical protein
MPRLGSAELVALHAVADEIRDYVEEHGYTVQKALDQHKAFRDTSTPRSTLLRRLVVRGVRRGASRQGGFGITDVAGGLELIWTSEGAHRRYRLMKAQQLASGEYVFIVNKGSSLLQAEPEGLWREERWVLGFATTGTESAQVGDIFVAEVLGATDESLKRLRLGAVVSLASGHLPGGPGSGFQSSDDDSLPGFDDERDDEEGSEGEEGAA